MACSTESAVPASRKSIDSNTLLLPYCKRNDDLPLIGQSKHVTYLPGSIAPVHEQIRRYIRTSSGVKVDEAVLK
jgi:hypothetical protein